MSLVIIGADTFVLKQVMWEDMGIVGPCLDRPGGEWERLRARREDVWHPDLFEWVLDQGIAHARDMIAARPGHVTSVVVTYGGDAIAIVRWNLDAVSADADAPPIEVCRFRDVMTVC